MAGNQFKAFDAALKLVTAENEVWLVDFAMTISLHQSATETQQQFFEKAFANTLGIIIFQKGENGEAHRHS